MPTRLGAHSPQLAAARELLSKKGRREQGRFAFEGPTLLAEALDANVAIDAVYVTAQAFERYAECARAERDGVAVYLADDKAIARISDVETPSGIVCVSATRAQTPQALLEDPGLVALLAGISDPGNAGTLLRSAEAFGVTRVLFGTGSVDPYHPKVVRAAMGAIFRLGLAPAEPAELEAAVDAGWTVTGLDARGEPIAGLSWPQRSVLAVGSERHGLGDFAPLCGRTAAIPMAGQAESLNAAIAGSIALYEAAKRYHAAR